MNNPNRISALGLLVLSAVSAHAAGFVDDFDVNSPAVSINYGYGYVGGSAVALGGGINRTLGAGIDSNAVKDVNKAGSVVSGGAYGFNSDAGVDGWGTLDYRFESLDFTGLVAMQIDFLSNDTAGYLSFTLGDVNSDAGFRPVEIPVSATPFRLLIDIPSYVSDDIDLAHLTSMSFTMDLDTGGHAKIDRIQQINGVQAVPEPASMVALGVGALGLLRRRRKA